MTIEPASIVSAEPSTTDPRAVRATAEVLALSLALIVLAGAAYALTPDRQDSLLPSDGWTVALLAIAFGASSLTVFRIEFRGNAILFSLSEIPLVFALVFFSPGVAIATRLVASFLVFAVVKRPPVHKHVFNLSVFAFETATAFLIAHHLVIAGAPSDVRLVLGVTVAVTCAGVLGSVAVAIAVSRFVDDTLRHIVDELKAAWVLVVNAAMAGALLSLFLVSPTLALLAIVPVIALWYMMRRHGLLAQKLRDLNAVYSFAGRVGRSLDLDEIGRSAISEAARLLRADVTTLALVRVDGSDHVFSTSTSPARNPEQPADWLGLMETSSAQLTTGHSVTAAGIDGFERCRDVIVAPVDDEIGAIGVLILGRHPTSDVDFSIDDLDQAVNLADQLGSSLRKGMLHRQIQYEASHDPLTHLPNRLAYQRHLDRVTADLRDDHPVYVMMMDLDRFKEVNDTLGHHAGDELLVEFARRMSAELSAGDFLARLAGDEFALITAANSDDEVADMAHRCIAAGAEPLTLNGMSLVVTASVGIARLTHDRVDPELPLRQADLAMYNAKSRHVGVEFFRPELDRRNPARLSMLGDLREAIAHGEIDVEFQPKLDLASGSITGTEALARWNHPIRGQVPPSDFVRVAEDTGLIQQLTDLMLARGIAELRQLHDRGHHLSLSVNLSTHDLLDAKLAGRVEQYLTENAVDAGALTLEITESSLLVEAPRSRANIQQLHELGVRLSIDDFGTGYSSLSYLRHLPVSELKVDQSFIANMLVDQQDEVIVRSTIDLGHNLGLEVVAEGVENEQTLRQLEEIGCDVAQGYTISRPLSAEHFRAWLHTTDYPSRRIDPMRPQDWPVDTGDTAQEPTDRHQN